MTTAIEFVWRAMGEPAACETDGTEMRPRAMGGARCAATGLPAEFRIDDAISDKFTTVTNRARWLPFGGGALHRSAVWACKALAFRAGSWFARETGVWWYPVRPLPGLKTPPRLRPDALEVLLSPPEPPFAAGLPLYGIDHGGEMHIERCVRWTDGRAHVEARPLAKACFYGLIEAASAPHQGIFLGLRASESRDRATNRAVNGTLYRRRSGQWTCCPLADWTGLDVLTYAHAHELELLHVYRCIGLMHSRAPWNLRKSWWIPGGSSTRHGQVAWLRHYWPSLYHKLTTMLRGAEEFR